MEKGEESQRSFPQPSLSPLQRDDATVQNSRAVLRNFCQIRPRRSFPPPSPAPPLLPSTSLPVDNSFSYLVLTSPHSCPLPSPPSLPPQPFLLVMVHLFKSRSKPFERGLAKFHDFEGAARRARDSIVCGVGTGGAYLDLSWTLLPLFLSRGDQGNTFSRSSRLRGAPTALCSASVRPEVPKGSTEARLYTLEAKSRGLVGHGRLDGTPVGKSAHGTKRRRQRR